MVILLWCLLSCRASSIVRVEILLGIDGLAQVRQFSVMPWKDHNLEICTQAAIACRGHFSCGANDQSSTGQSGGESLQPTHGFPLGCAPTEHTAGLQDPPKDVEPPGQPAATETGNRGGEASTSASGPSLAEPTGNDHTAKWKVYTSLAKKLVAQVPLHLSRCSAC